MDLDFEGNGNVQGVQTPATGTTTNSTTPDSTPIDGAPDVDDVTAKDGDTKPSDGTTPVEKNDDTTIPHSLEVGTQIEFDGANYKVADNGDIVDDKGNVFKEAKDVKAWLDENNTESDDDSELSLTAIQNAIGISVTDEQGNPVVLDGGNVLTSSYIVSKARVEALPPTDEWTPFEMFFEDIAPVDDTILENFGYNLALVFSSSKDGAQFCGAIGSTLYIDNVVISLEKE